MEFLKNKLVAGAIAVNVVLFLSFLFSHHYPTVLMLIHIITLVLLWGRVLKKLHLVSLIRSKWKEVIIICLLVIVAFCVRMYRIEEISPGMYMDEVGVAVWGLQLLHQPELPPFVAFGYTHPTPLLYLTGESVTLFGHTMTAIRLPSVLFGALSVGAFYILLRLFFPVTIATIGGLLLVFQYTHVVLSRLAYEPPPSLFCQIIVAIFLVLYHKTKEKIFLLGIALGIGLGMYTYLNFRAFAVVVFLLTLCLILKKQWRQHWQTALGFCISVFVAMMPLVSYQLIDPIGFSGRVLDISIFSRHYSQSEFIKELGGNIYRTSAIPFIGDPNPGKNPSGVPLFDALTLILAFLGLIVLFKKSRTLFLILLLFFLPPLISDVFSTEVIPEGHYYGLGHPNALRVSGFIGVILFVATYALQWIYSLKEKKYMAEKTTVLFLLVVIISTWNWALYFNQVEINPTFYQYNYIFNHADIPQLATYLNQSPVNNIQITNDFATDGYLHFFLNPSKKITAFQLTTVPEVLVLIQKSETTVMSVNVQTVKFLNALTTEDNLNILASKGYTSRQINNPVTNFQRFVIFEKTPSLSPLLQ